MRASRRDTGNILCDPMSTEKYKSTDDFLKDPTGDITKLRAMGITNFAIISYMVHVREGQSKSAALAALLAGRHLTPEQVEFVRGALDRLPNPPK
jgi:hypothetical protein